MGNFKSRFTKIKGTSEVRRLPRLGKIRLGIKAISKKTGNEYPKETSYFICPDEVKEVYRDKFPNGEITSLDVMFPINDPEVVFPQAYKYYGQTRGLKCIGNGEIATRFSEDKSSIEEIECPCELLEQKKCQRRAHLLIILPKVNMGGIYQIDIGSFHSIVDINSGIDYVRALSQEILGIDRFALIPLVLKREPIETHFEGGKQTHYTLHLYSTLNAEQWNRIKSDFRIISPDERIALPPVEDINPAFDEGATVVEVEEEAKDTKEPQPQKPKNQKFSAKLPDEANQYLTVSEIAQWEKWNADVEEKLTYAEDEIMHRKHIIMSFGEMRPKLLAIIREIRKDSIKYNWEKFKKEILLNAVWKELNEKDSVKEINEWKIKEGK